MSSGQTLEASAAYLELRDVTRVFRGRGRARRALKPEPAQAPDPGAVFGDIAGTGASASAPDSGPSRDPSSSREAHDPMTDHLRGAPEALNEGGTRALDGVSLALHTGRSLGIVGESGAGKSTILNLLLGLDRPTSGSVLWNGAPLPAGDRTALREYRRQVQMVFQDPRSSLDPRMSVGRIVAEPLRSLRVSGNHRERVHEVLRWVGLDPTLADRYPAQFSGGQRQRIAIARALAPSPQLLIADEPLSALDVSVKASLIELLGALKAELGLTLLMVSHDIAVVGQLCEEIVVLQGGRVVEAGATLDVLGAPQQPYTRQLLAAIPQLPQ